jgi:FkbM family methyltransferase
MNSVPGGKALLGKIQVQRKHRSMQREIARRLAEIAIKPGDVILDFGANVGFFSDGCLARGAVVHAYEPDPECFKALQALKARHAAFHPHNAAVGRATGTASLYRHRDYAENSAYYAESSSLLADKTNVGGATVEVAVEDVDSVLAAHPHIAILKVDIEGSEYDIFEPILANAGKIGLVLMETHADALPARRADHDRMVAEISRLGLERKVLLNWF